MNTAISAMFYEGFFIRWPRAQKIAKLWLLFLQKYSLATALVYRRGLNRFALVPKIHMLHHGAIRLLREAERAEEDSTTWAVNPLGESVQMQEDWIGRPSRLSRRVCPKQIHLRVCQRSLISTMACLKRADIDQRGLFSLGGGWVLKFTFPKAAQTALASRWLTRSDPHILPLLPVLISKVLRYVNSTYTLGLRVAVQCCCQSLEGWSRQGQNRICSWSVGWWMLVGNPRILNTYLVFNWSSYYSFKKTEYVGYLAKLALANVKLINIMLRLSFIHWYPRIIKNCKIQRVTVFTEDPYFFSNSGLTYFGRPNRF